MPMASRPIPAASHSAWIALRSRCSTPTAPRLLRGPRKCARCSACSHTPQPTAISKAGGEADRPKTRPKTVTALRPQIRCREIREADLDAVADLVTRGFVVRPRDYWLQGLSRQAERDVPQGYPRFGYMLDHEGKPVGVLLLLYSRSEE